MDDLLGAIIVNKIISEDVKDTGGPDMTDGQVAFGRFLIKGSITLVLISFILVCVAIAFSIM